MFSTSARFSAIGFFLTIAQALLCLFINQNNAFADWNSGVTIEDASTRLAINIVNDGIHLSINLTDDAITQLLNADLSSENKTTKLSTFALSVLKISTSQHLPPIVQSNNLHLASSTSIEVFFSIFENTAKTTRHCSKFQHY